MADNRLPPPAGKGNNLVVGANNGAVTTPSAAPSTKAAAAPPPQLGTTPKASALQLANAQPQPAPDVQKDIPAAGKSVKLPIFGPYKVLAWKALASVAAVVIGSTYYGDPQKQKVKVLSEGVTAGQAAVADQYKSQGMSQADMKKRFESLNHSGGPVRQAPTGEQLIMAQKAAAAAESARTPSMAELTRTAPGAGPVEKGATYLTAGLVKGAGDSHWMGGLTAAALLLISTTFTRFVSTRPIVAKNRGVPGASFSQGAGVTQLIYGYDMKEKQYMDGLKETKKNDLMQMKYNLSLGKDPLSPLEPGPTEAAKIMQRLTPEQQKARLAGLKETLDERHELSALQPTLFPWFRPSRVEDGVADVTPRGEKVYAHVAKPGTTVGEKLGADKPKLKSLTPRKDSPSV